MKNNAVMPYAVIAIIGILFVIVLSVAGNNQRTTLENEKDNAGTEESKEGAKTEAPEDIFSNSCASCHANDLSGGFGPDLTKVGAKLSKDDIHDIILNGRGNMPAQDLNEEQSQAVAGWLAEHK